MRLAATFAVALWLSLAMFLAHGCAAAPDAVRKGTTVAAVAVDEADEAATSAFREQWPRALEEADSPDDLHDFERRWRRTRDAVASAYSALRGLEHVVDAWDDTAGDRRMDAIRAALSALQDLAAALVDAGVDLPGQLAKALSVLGAYAGGDS